jgi:uncharacterized protein with FMN-binding domain
MAEGNSINRSTKKGANGLVAASCTAVLAVYSAGYVRTKSAMDHFEAQAAHRRMAFPESHPMVRQVDGPRSAIRTEPAIEKSFRPDPTRDSAPASRRLTPAVPSSPAVSEPHAVETAEPITSAATNLPIASGSGSATLSIPEPLVPAPEMKVAAVAAEPAAPKWKDGTYLGWGYSRHGEIEAEVVIQTGRIASASISQCRTRYSCSVIEQLPPQVALRQSPEVDYVSGATQSADAFYSAVVDALEKAK